MTPVYPIPEWTSNLQGGSPYWLHPPITFPSCGLSCTCHIFHTNSQPCARCAHFLMASCSSPSVIFLDSLPEKLNLISVFLVEFLLLSAAITIKPWPRWLRPSGSFALCLPLWRRWFRRGSFWARRPQYLTCPPHSPRFLIPSCLDSRCCSVFWVRNTSWRTYCMLPTSCWHRPCPPIPSYVFRRTDCCYTSRRRPGWIFVCCPTLLTFSSVFLVLYPDRWSRSRRLLPPAMEIMFPWALHASLYWWVSCTALASAPVFILLSCGWNRRRRPRFPLDIMHRMLWWWGAS